MLYFTFFDLCIFHYISIKRMQISLHFDDFNQMILRNQFVLKTQLNTHITARFLEVHN